MKRMEEERVEGLGSRERCLKLKTGGEGGGGDSGGVTCEDKV